MNDKILNPYSLFAPSKYWDMLTEDNPELKKICNGVGSETSWTYHFIPNTIYGLSIIPVSDKHDFMYTYPKAFPAMVDDEYFKTGLDYKNHADRVFLNNCIRLFEYHEKLSGFTGWMHRRLAGVRRARAYEYFEILQKFGGTSFWEDKDQSKI